MAVCQECKKEKGCGCTFSQVPTRSYAVCPECKKKLVDQIKESEKQGKQTEIRTPNVQGI